MYEYLHIQKINLYGDNVSHTSTYNIIHVYALYIQSTVKHIYIDYIRIQTV